MKFFIGFIFSIMLCACVPNPTPGLNRAAKINSQLVYAYVQEHQMERAKEKLLLALNQAPNAPDVLAAAGYFYAKSNNISFANQYYQKAIKLAPTEGRYRNNYAVFLCKRGRQKEAIKYFKQAAKIPSYLHAKNALDNSNKCANVVKN